MKGVFTDMQDCSSPLEGATVRTREELFALLDSVRDRQPFICELEGENGYKLALGISKDLAWVQHSPSDDDPPYFVAVATAEGSRDEEVEFLMDNTQTPLPKRHCVPFATMREIAACFLETGERSSAVTWEEV